VQFEPLLHVWASVQWSALEQSSLLVHSMLALQPVSDVQMPLPLQPGPCVQSVGFVQVGPVEHCDPPVQPWVQPTAALYAADAAKLIPNAQMGPIVGPGQVASVGYPHVAHVGQRGHSGPIEIAFRHGMAAGPDWYVAQSDVLVMNASPEAPFCPRRMRARSFDCTTSSSGTEQCGQRCETSTPTWPHVMSPVSALCPAFATAAV
jgi:hypothetical protein